MTVVCQDTPNAGCTQLSFLCTTDAFIQGVCPLTCFGGSGDANTDGEVSVVDIVQITLFLTGEGELPSLCFVEIADVSNDGDVTVADIVLIVESLTL